MPPIKKKTPSKPKSTPTPTPTPTPTSTTPKPEPKPKPAPVKERTLQQIGEKLNLDKATFHKYCEDYQKLLDPIKSKIKKIVEIGDISAKDMWEDWIPGVKVTVLTQQQALESPILLQGVDLVVDDGDHFWRDQITTFNNSWKSTALAYIIEDLQTSINKAYKLGPTPTYTNGENPDESFPALDFHSIDHTKHVIKNGEDDSWAVVFIKN